MKFPTLYKKTSVGNLQQWSIWTQGSTITTEHGAVGGKMVRVEDTLKVGKNAGRSNATSAKEQAEIEAQAKHTGKLKKGYVLQLNDAKDGKLDEIIEGGFEPMLAKSFADRKHKIKYPCAGQYKFDGGRGPSVLENKKATLWTRTRKPIYSVPHIIKELTDVSKKFGDNKLDGELYNHAFKDNFEHIIHLFRQTEPVEGHTDVQYHIYDMVSTNPFSMRSDRIKELLKGGYQYLLRVRTVILKDEAEVVAFHDEAVELGYEGIMLRNLDDSGYEEGHRSDNLLKVKIFEDAEFKILGVEEGRGRLQGHVGAFVLMTPGGVEFRAKLDGAQALLKKYFENPKLWRGKQATVKFQGVTNKNSVPRFPVMKAVRDYE
jgi:DNA ligase-1